MASYKVIQDIEADDKLLGPLSLIQFIFACMSAGFLYMCYLGVVKNIPFLLAIFLPLAAIGIFFAIPWGREQPTEIWALAKLKYLLYPHVRIWDQSGAKNLVTITAPKKIQIQYTNGLSQEEAQGRLKALAETIDSRGWATKNSNVNLVSSTAVARPVIMSDDRLASGSMETEASTAEVKASDDVLDEKNNPTASKFTEKIKEASEKHRRELEVSIAKKQTNTPTNKWFSGPTTDKSKENISTLNSNLINNGYTPEQEKAISEELAAKHEKWVKQFSGWRIEKPSTESKKPVNKAQTAPVNNVTQPTDPAIINMARSNDLFVSTIAHEANKQFQLTQGDEVVINLH